MKLEVSGPCSVTGAILLFALKSCWPCHFLLYLLSQGYHKEFQTCAETPSRNITPTLQLSDPCHKSPPFCPGGWLVCAGIRTRVMGSCRSSFFVSPLSSSPYEG